MVYKSWKEQISAINDARTAGKFVTAGGRGVNIYVTNVKISEGGQCYLAKLSNSIILSKKLNFS